MTGSHRVGPHGSRVLLFVNNPHEPGYLNPSGLLPGYDILTDRTREASNYTVPANRKAIDDGDLGFVYRVRQGAIKRDPGEIVGFALITSPPTRRGADTIVSWRFQPLPPEQWIAASEMKASGLWRDKNPFTDQNPVHPTELDGAQWGWITDRLPAAARERLEAHTRRGARRRMQV